MTLLLVPRRTHFSEPHFIIVLTRNNDHNHELTLEWLFHRLLPRPHIRIRRIRLMKLIQARRSPFLLHEEAELDR